MIKTNTFRWVGNGGSLRLFPSTALAGVQRLGTYISRYPATFDPNTVKTTTQYSTGQCGYMSCNPANSPIGSGAGTCWLSAQYGNGSQKFHIDLGQGRMIQRIYYENYHTSGSLPTRGIRVFTFFGSNNSADFADLVYAHAGGWTQLPCAAAEFDQHVALNQADPKFILAENINVYRYYGFKINSNWGDAYLAVRRIELQESL